MAKGKYKKLVIDALERLERELDAHNESISLGSPYLSEEDVIKHRGAIEVLKEILGKG